MLRSVIAMPSDASFWEDPAQVQRFAALEPDELLLDLLVELRGAAPFVVLDLGCAAGRNSEALVCASCRVLAVDLSAAMTHVTRDRLARLDASSSGRSMVVRGRFDQIPVSSGSVDLVVAVGIYVQANADAELRAGLAETHRVLKPNGRVFVSMWSTQTLPPGARRVEGEQFIYAAEPGQTKCRLDRDELVDLMAEAGMSLDRPITERHPVRDGKPHVALVGVFVKQ